MCRHIIFGLSTVSSASLTLKKYRRVGEVEVDVFSTFIRKPEAATAV
jgi:hypothetical protein